MAQGRHLIMLPLSMARLGKHLPLKVLAVDFRGIPRPTSVVTLNKRTLSPLALLFIEEVRRLANRWLGWNDSRAVAADAGSKP